MVSRRSVRGLLAIGICSAVVLTETSCGGSPSEPAPTALSVSSITPALGSIGAALTINGTGFRNGTTVRLGGVPATVTGVWDPTITVVAPSHSTGIVDLIVTNPGGATATLAGAFTYVPLTLTSIETPIGFAGIQLRLTGSGFLPSTGVTMGGIQATTVGINHSTMFVTIPAHAPGPVDVIARNPSGETAALEGGFTYAIPPTLALSATSVAAGGQVQVTWTATTRWGLDWIGLFKVDSSNSGWLQYVYTGGTTAGTWTMTMPMEPGQYEFRYLPNDSYVDIARSSIVTVTSQ